MFDDVASASVCSDGYSALQDKDHLLCRMFRPRLIDSVDMYLSCLEALLGLETKAIVNLDSVILVLTLQDDTWSQVLQLPNALALLPAIYCLLSLGDSYALPITTRA